MTSDSLVVSIESVRQFYSLVSILNNRFGHGKENWTMKGRPLRCIRALGQQEAYVVTVIFPKGASQREKTEIKLSI